MLGLGNSINSSCFVKLKLPVNGNYIHLEDAYVSAGTGITSPVVIHTPTEMSFDDTYSESFELVIGLVTLYDETGTDNYDYANPQLVSGTSITLSGKIRQRDSDANFNDDSDNGFINFKLSTDNNDNLKVFVDSSYSGSVNTRNQKVDGNGDFTFTHTLNSDIDRLVIQAGDIEFDPISTDPGIRISNLSLTIN